MKIIFTGFFLFLIAVSGCQPSSPEGHVEFINHHGEIVGHAHLTETDHGVKIQLRVEKLPPGVHALHIHAVGKAEPPDFTSAGGHFNPKNREHGVENPKGAHAGDLSNVAVNADGVLETEVTAAGVTLKKWKDNSLFHRGGTSIVIHENPDDLVTDPVGNAGGRIACGVITRL